MDQCSRCSPVRLWPGTLLLCLLAISCGGSSGSSVVTEEDSAGVRILTSVGAGWPRETAWHLELDLEVGDLDGPNSFARVRDVAVRRAGGFWVLDGQARRVRGFDNDGKAVLAFGGHGQGPGEFTFVDYIYELADGDIVVGGSGPIALHRFDSEGNYQSTDVLPDSAFRRHFASERESRPPAGPSFGKWRVGSDGSVFVQTVVIDAEGESIVRSDVLFRLMGDGQGATRLTQWNSPLMKGGPGGTMRLLQPNLSWAAVADGGVWVTDGTAYELRRLDRSGDLTTILHRLAAVVPVSPYIKREVLRILSEDMDSDFEQMMLAKAEFPANLPATYGLWISDPSGQLWVGVRDPTLPWNYEGANAWDVFEPDGEFLGRLPVPEGFRPTRVTEDYVIGIWLDELDVSHARRYRIVRSAG